MSIVISGGGTGGHVFPGIAIANKIRSINSKVKLVFVGTKTGIENKLVPQYNIKLETIRVFAFNGKNFKDKIRALMNLPLSVFISCKLLYKIKAKFVLGLGGYVSVPVIIAAIIMRKDIFLCEQNAVPGLTNRIFKYFAKQIFLSFAYSKQFFSKRNFILTGNPLRNGFIFKKKDYCKNLINILVLGGSGGSHFINFCIPYAMKLLKKKKISISLEHQTGLKDYNKIVKIYKKFGLNVKIKTFISDILFSYRKADLLIARSGATTCAETSALGLPAIFIPFPESVYNHQIFNAMILAQSGGAILLPQSDLTPNNLFNIITDLIFNIRTLQVMSNKIFSFSKYDATKRISKILLSHL